MLEKIVLSEDHTSVSSIALSSRYELSCETGRLPEPNEYQLVFALGLLGFVSYRMVKKYWKKK